MDLTKILDLAESWLHTGKAPDRNVQRRPMADFFSGKDEWQQSEFANMLTTLEDVVLLSRRASQKQRDRANNLIERAHASGWCVTQVAATRVLYGFMTTDQAVSDIRLHLGDPDPFGVRQSCDAIVWWYEHAETRGLAVPAELYQILAALVVERRHNHLALLISTCKDIIERSEITRRVLFAAIRDGLETLLHETSYNGENESFSIGKKLQIRVSLAKLAVTATKRGVSDPILQRMFDVIGSDKFGDVRRELSR
jgi:hypothetical protein